MSTKEPRRQNRQGRLSWIGNKPVFHNLGGISTRADSGKFSQLVLEIEDFLEKFAEIGPQEARAARAVRKVLLENEPVGAARDETAASKSVYYRCLGLLRQEMQS